MIDLSSLQCVALRRGTRATEVRLSILSQMSERLIFKITLSNKDILGLVHLKDNSCTNSAVGLEEKAIW